MSYHTDSAEKATVAEEDDEHWDGEVQDEHVDDKRGGVDLRFGSVIIYSTGALHSLWNIPAHSHMTNKPRVRTSASVHELIVLSRTAQLHTSRLWEIQDSVFC